MAPTPARLTALRRLKACAIVCLSLLVVDIVGQIIRQDDVRAVVGSIMLLIAIGIFLLKRYWWAILLVAITLVGSA